MALPRAAEANYRNQQRISVAASGLARQLWATVPPLGDFDPAWAAAWPRLVVVVASAQVGAATAGAAYVPEVLGELNIDADPVGQPVPRALSGMASDGRQLAPLLELPMVYAKTLIGQGAEPLQALRAGRDMLDRIVLTQVADAGRAGESVASVVRPKVTRYVRMLNLPSCDRCVVLAGRVYRAMDAFDRHPRCDCRHIPASEAVAGDLTLDATAAIDASQVTNLSRRDARAIADGADPAKVINAKRGMSPAQVGGKRLRKGATTANAARGEVRLRPEGIYRLAGDDRGKAIDLLRQYGYIV